MVMWKDSNTSTFQHYYFLGKPKRQALHTCLPFLYNEVFMIKIKKLKNGIEITGHARSDICAAVSTLTCTVYNIVLSRLCRGSAVGYSRQRDAEGGALAQL